MSTASRAGTSEPVPGPRFRNKRVQLLSALLAGALLAYLAISLQPSDAQPVKHLVLDSARAEWVGECLVLRIGFTLPVRYLRHAPPAGGASLIVQLETVELGPAQDEGLRRREAVPVTGAAPLPLSSVVYDGTTEGPAHIVLDFDASVAFSVEQGEDFRSLVVRIAPSGRITDCGQR